MNKKYVTINLEKLYNKLALDNSKCEEIDLSFGKIQAVEGWHLSSSEPYHFNFVKPHNNTIYCMTGEKCEIISMGDEMVILRNFYGEEPVDFTLSLEEFNIVSKDIQKIERNDKLNLFEK